MPGLPPEISVRKLGYYRRNSKEFVFRYRKYNLNGEEGVDKPKTAEMVTFTTDFDITFGMFTGWDILFRPAADLVRERKVKNIIFPNAWRGELPFLTGTFSVKRAYSALIGVMVLQACNCSPDGATP